MRTTQYIGLNKRAEKFLKENSLSQSDNGRHTIGMFMEKIPLTDYVLKDGRIAQEVEQCSPWSSGPMIFICLEVNGMRLSEVEWTDDEINHLVDG